MTSEEKPKKTSDELAQDRTDLAYDRTALANDRTLMAWIRTSTSLISFGFTIYKFFQDMVSKDASVFSKHLISSKEVGMILIAFGFFGLFFGLLQYRLDMKSIRISYPKKRLFSFTPVLAILMLIFSLFLFFAAVYNQ